LDELENKDKSESIYFLTRDSLVDQGVVFLGGYGTALYSKYMAADQRHQVKKIPDFDVLSEDPEKCALIVRDRLMEAGYKHVKIVQHTPLGEVIPAHIEISVKRDIIAIVYKPIACHSYNKIDVGGKEVRVATIDTMLSFYLAFLYADKPYFDKDRMLCMAAYLFEVEQKNSLEQKGLLKRFSLDCYGVQPSMEDIRAEKARKYVELKESGDKKEFEQWFLKYTPKMQVRNQKWRGEQAPLEKAKTPSKTVVLVNTKTQSDNSGSFVPVKRTRRKRRPNRRAQKSFKDRGPYARRA
jgi:hypothetical protein